MHKAAEKPAPDGCESGAEPEPDVYFKRITAGTVRAVCALSQTLSPAQRSMVAHNGDSIAEAHYSENAWVRAIHADDTLVGFIMLHIGSDYDDGIDCPGVFLWRFMIAGPYQGRGYGRLAVRRLVAHLRALGVPELYTSCGSGEASPEAFYRKLGFVPTGDWYGDEKELVLRL
jgi:diamine N-acetyltransferase